MQKHPVKDLPQIDVVSDILLELTDTGEFISNTFVTHIEEVKEVVYCEMEQYVPNEVLNENFINCISARVIHNRYEIVKQRSFLSILTKKEYDLRGFNTKVDKTKELMLYQFRSCDEFGDVILRLKDYLKDDYIGYELVNRFDGKLEFRINFYSYDTKLLKKY
jgi:hypothetical protein